MSPKSKAPERPKQKITRDDIEAKLRELRGDVDDRVEEVKAPVTAIAIGIAVVTVAAAYWFGRRRGRKRQMVLEIRRI
jgi:hypothetical protein